MPDAFADELAGEGVEFQADRVAAFRGEDTEAVLEVLFDGEIGGTHEGRGAELGIFHPGEDEGAKGVTLEAVADNIPLVLDAGEVVGLEASALVFGGIQFLVVEMQFHAFANSFAGRLEGCEVHRGDLKTSERHQSVEIAPSHSQMSREVGGQFIKGATQGSLERSALVLSEGFLADENRDELRLGQFHHGEAGNGLGEAVSPTLLIVGDR